MRDDQLKHYQRMVSEVLYHRPCGLISDIDGTISAIAPSPREAVVEPKVRQYLERLAKELDLVAVVTGRPVLEARELVGVDGLVYIGNHGLERWDDGFPIRHPGIGRYLPYLDDARRTLHQELGAVSGLVIEDKGVSLSVHYRKADRPAAARSMILEVISKSPWAKHLQVSEGKKVVELRPPLHVNKGTAVSGLINRYNLTGAVYLGDDLSDLDAFRVLRQWRQMAGRFAVAIAVLGTDRPNEVAKEADININGHEDVKRLLAWLSDEYSGNAKQARRSTGLSSQGGNFPYVRLAPFRLTKDIKELCRAAFDDKKPIIVSNRGPVEHCLSKDGELETRRGSGGVVTALAGLMQFTPVSWVASAITNGDRQAAELYRKDDSCPPICADSDSRLRLVVPPREVYDRYYNVFSNPILWLLQHSLWDMLSPKDLNQRINEGWYRGYLPVNQAFAQAALSELASDDNAGCILLHDYHLYVAPAFIRARAPQTVLSHFIHIPWPDPQTWRNLPQPIVEAILRGLLANDIVGFQASQSLENFLSTCQYFMPKAEVDFASGEVAYRGRLTRARSYPISVNIDDLRERMESAEVRAYKQMLLPLCEEFTIVRVDRLDPAKNVLAGFEAFDVLLQRQPDLVGRVKFLVFLVPSRTDIPEYQRYAAAVFRRIDQINGRYQQSGWRPIEVFYENNYSQALAGLSLYDVLLVNSVADGMNLVAKEGAVVNERDGVLLLARTVGAYEDLGDAAVVIDDPKDIVATAEAMAQALSLPYWVRRSRSQRLRRTVEERDTSLWLWSQLQDLRHLVAQQHLTGDGQTRGLETFLTRPS